jgi:hypothetical protein
MKMGSLVLLLLALQVVSELFTSLSAPNKTHISLSRRTKHRERDIAMISQIQTIIKYSYAPGNSNVIGLRKQTKR